MYQNAVGVGDVVRRLDVVARDEVGEDRSGDVVEEVAGLNGVDGDALGDAGAVGAGAGERDVDDLASLTGVVPGVDSGRPLAPRMDLRSATPNRAWTAAKVVWFGAL